MPYYKISLTYDVGHGDEVTLDINNIEANNQADALDRLPALLERIDQLEGHPQINAIKASAENPVPKNIDIVPVPAPPPVREGRFILQRSELQEDRWICGDTDYKAVAIWQEHRFNETKHITFLDDSKMDYLERARVMREMGDWLSKNHHELLF